MITGDNDTHIDKYKKGCANEQQESAWTRHSEANTLLIRVALAAEGTFPALPDYLSQGATMTATTTTLVYFSPTNTTKAVLTAIADGIGLPAQHIDLTLPDARQKSYAFGKDELVIIGFPVYAGRVPLIHEIIFPLLADGPHPVVPVVVYGNREYDDALLELTSLCQSKGYVPAAAAAFIGEHSYAPALGTKRPDDDDKALATNFGARLAASLRQGTPFNTACIPGASPYKERGPKLPTVPETDENCIRCLICVRKCPVGAIAPDNPAAIDQEACILCAACVKKCPARAKRITFAPLLQRVEAMAAANMTPKAPALFLPE